MSTTPKPFVRRAGLIAWLEEKGFTAAHVDALISAGVIPRRHHKHRRRNGPGSKVRAAAQGAARQHPKPGAESATGPELINGRAWYFTPEVATALQIEL